MTKGIAVIGHGAMARSLIAGLARERPVDMVLLRPGSATTTPAGLRRFTAPAGLIAARPALVVECAGHDAVREAVPEILAAGIDVVLASIGALGEAALRDRLAAAAAAGGARLALASGAIGGLDVLRAARHAGLTRVAYTGRKPARAWAGTPAEAAHDLATLAAPTVIYEGDAAGAARAYPRNANVTAAVALAGLGFEATRVTLVADPRATANTHELVAEGAFGEMRIALANAPLPDNPRTSWLAALSLQESVLRHFRRVD